MNQADERQPVPESDHIKSEPSLIARTVKEDKFTQWISLGFLVLALSVAVGVRIRLLNFPLERDEGEYAYAGQLILEGIPPYHLAYNMKMPGTYLAYAVLMSVFGETTVGIHLGLLAVHLATLAVLFLIARKLLDIPGAAIATAAYALMTLSPAYFGLAAHATHFVMLPALLGVWILLRAEEKGRLWDCGIAGLLFGVAFLMKQQGVFFGIFGGLYLGWANLTAKAAWPQLCRRLGLYALACLLPFLAICVWLKIAGVFQEFWFWTYSYARDYVGMVPVHEGIGLAATAMANIAHAAPLLWLIAGLGLAGVFLTQRPRKLRIFFGGFSLFSGLAVCPGFYFRGHYFIVVVPAVALLVGAAVTWSGQLLTGKPGLPWLHRLPFLLAALACTQSLLADRAIFFSSSPDEACRAVYNVAPFPESPEIARHLAQLSRQDERVVVIGSEPQLYFYAHRHSSTGYIYTYPLMEPQPFARTMQENMIREIKQNPPAALVLVGTPNSWDSQQDSSHQLLDWVAGYLNTNMQQVGLIQHTDDQTTESVWGPDAAVTPLRSEFFVAVFKRVAPGGPDGQVRLATARNKLLIDAFYRGQNDSIIHQLGEMLRRDPTFARAHENLASLLAGEGQADAAIGEYQASLRLQPNNAPAHFNLGGLLLQQGRWDAAMDEFQACVQLNPKDAEAHYNLGNLLTRKGQVNAAIQEFGETIQLQPGDAIAHNNLGLLLAGIGQTNAAFDEFREALRLTPENAQIHCNFGMALVKAGQLDAGSSQFQEALRLQPDDPAAQKGLARAGALKGQQSIISK